MKHHTIRIQRKIRSARELGGLRAVTLQTYGELHEKYSSTCGAYSDSDYDDAMPI